MTEALLKQLMAVTEEERAILKGRSSIDRDLYMQDQDHTVNAGKLLGQRGDDEELVRAF